LSLEIDVLGWLRVVAHLLNSAVAASLAIYLKQLMLPANKMHAKGDSMHS
jgi:hypothetical protein